jgi:hypothetical protein
VGAASAVAGTIGAQWCAGQGAMSISLEASQINLLVDLVEASHKVPPEQREEFFAYQPMGGGDSRVPVTHRGLPRAFLAHPQDIEVLGREGLIAVRQPDPNMWVFFVLPQGKRYYEHVKQKTGVPIVRVEQEMRSLIDGQRFQQRYSSAYKKWADAERLLWVADSTDHISKIGLGCREAMQEFASTLVGIHTPPQAEQNPALTKNRLRSVVESKRASLGEAEQTLLGAMIEYWWALDGVVNRLVHANTKEGRPVTVEDARRVVFQAVCIMYEIDRALDQTPAA